MAEFIIQGFVGAVPELKSVKGVDVSEFIVSLPCGNADKQKKIWVKCVAWGNLALKVKEHVFQGDLVGINGRIWDVRAWIDKKGKPQGSLEIRADKIFRGPKIGQLTDISIDGKNRAAND